MGPERADDVAIEALRGFAALAVAASHYARFVAGDAGAWGFAATGVDLFFVLSGYVFAPYLFGRPLSAGPHFVRRLFRLYPLYVVALLAYAALRLPDGSAWRYFGEHLLMLHTLRSQEVAFFYNPAFWSLPPEVEFYLFLPLVAGRLRPRGFTWLLAGALALHLALASTGVHGEATARAVATVHLPGLLIEFCLGALAYKVVRERPAAGAAAQRLFAGIAWLIALAVFYSLVLASGRDRSVPTWVSGNFGLAAAAGYALVVSGLATRAQRAGPLAGSLCRVAGQLSYAVYLFHNAAAQVVERFLHASGWSALLASAGLTIALAWLLHHGLEAPARTLGRRLGQRFAVVPGT